MTVIVVTLLGAALSIALGVLYVRLLDRPAERTVTVTITVDDQFSEAMGNLAEAARHASFLTRGMDDAFRRLTQAAAELNGSVTARSLVRDERNGWLKQTFLDRRWEAELNTVRWETTWYMRGALDPAYATPEARDAWVQSMLMQGWHVGAQAMAHNLRLVTAFLRGWVERADAPPEVWWFVGRPDHHNAGVRTFRAVRSLDGWWGPDTLTTYLHMPPMVQGQVIAERVS